MDLVYFRALDEKCRFHGTPRYKRGVGGKRERERVREDLGLIVFQSSQKGTPQGRPHVQ